MGCGDNRKFNCGEKVQSVCVHYKGYLPEYSELDKYPPRFQVPAGETVTVLAEADSGYKFVRWSYKGGVTEDNPYSMIINENMVLRCIFEQIPLMSTFDLKSN